MYDICDRYIGYDEWCDCCSCKAARVQAEIQRKAERQRAHEAAVVKQKRFLKPIDRSNIQPRNI